MPFAHAAVRLEVLSGVRLGTKTVRPHAQVGGTALVEAETAAAEQVLATQAAAEPVEVAAELLVVEMNGVNVRFTDGYGWRADLAGQHAADPTSSSTPTQPTLRRSSARSFGRSAISTRASGTALSS